MDCFSIYIEHGALTYSIAPLLLLRHGCQCTVKEEMLIRDHGELFPIILGNVF